jgi:hypothetical protein
MSEPTDFDGPPSAELAALLDTLAQPPRADELVDEPKVVASMQSVIAAAGTTRGAPMTPTQKRVRIAAIAAAGLVVVGGAAAAGPGGFDPVDRPPTIDPPPASVPPVELPEAARGAPHQTSPTTAPTAVAPADIVCAEGNHGKTVSSVAQATPPGPEHGTAVAAAAQSDCGKTLSPDDPAETSAGGERGRPEDPGPPADSPANTAPGRPEDPGPPADSPANTAPGRPEDPGPPANTAGQAD